MEICFLFLFCIRVTIPTIDYYFLYRNCFVDLFYPDYQEDDPIFDFNLLNDYFDDVINSASVLINDLFMDIRTPLSSDTVSFEVLWKNGSISVVDYPDLSLEFFSHCQYINLALEFYIFSKEQRLSGCSHFTVGAEISSQINNNQFIISSWIERNQIMPELISN
jgi:hypothetical protein